MARRARVAAAAGALLLASALAVADAQTYATLHVRRFTMSVDRSPVAIGEPFHLTIAAHVDETVTQLDNLTLPDLAGFESLGDERSCIAASTGSDCTETVTIAATIAGTRTIPGATLDAIDARNGKPSRFTSDSVTIAVTGAPPSDPFREMATDFLFGVLRALVILTLIAVAIAALVWGFVTRRRTGMPRPAPAAYAPPPPPPPPPDPDAALRALADALARDPTRANALRLRAALRQTMSARDEETFGDLAARGAAPPARLGALAAVERASFCEDDRVAEAVREALPSLNF